MGNNFNTTYYCFVNIGTLTSSGKGGIKEAMLNKIVASLNMNCKVEEEAVKKTLHRKTLILVLDEIDMMLKKTHGGQSWFKTLISWAESKELRFSMIGISNSVNDENAQIVREFGNVSRCDMQSFPTWQGSALNALPPS